MLLRLVKAIYRPLYLLFGKPSFIQIMGIIPFYLPEKRASLVPIGIMALAAKLEAGRQAKKLRKIKKNKVSGTKFV